MRGPINSFATHSLYALVSLALISITIPCFADILGSGTAQVPRVAKQVAKLSGADNITGMDFSADGASLAVAALGDEVAIWNWQRGRIERKLQDTHSGSNLASQAIRFSQDGQFLASCHGLSTIDTVARIWSAQQWTVMHDLAGLHACYAIDFSRDGKSAILVLLTIIESPENSIAVYDTADWRTEWALSTGPFYPRTLALSADGRFAAVGGEVRNPKSWTYKNPVPTFGTPPLPDMNLICIVDLDDHAFAGIIKHTVDFERGKLSWSSTTDHIAAIGSRERDGSSGGTGNTDTLSVFEASSGRRIDGEQIDEPGYAEVAYTSNGKYLIETDVTGIRAGWGIRILDGQHHNLLQTIAGEYEHLAISRDGRHFAVNDNNKIYVFELQ